MKVRYPILVFIALLLAVGARAQELPAAFNAAPLTLLQLNDVYEIAPVQGGKAGGLARVATLKKQVASPGRTVLLLLAGDFLSPSVDSTVFKGKQMVAALNAAGLDVATLGNHEFDFGPEVLRQRMAEAKFQWVVTNVLDAATRKPVGGAAPFVIRQCGPFRVGFLGLCLTGAEISPRNTQGLTMVPPLEAAAKTLPELQRRGADVIVALTHQGYPDDRKLVERFPQIDLVVGGHEHYRMTATVNRTLISKTGENAEYVGRIDLLRPDAKSPLEKHIALLPVTPALADDPTTAAVVKDYEGQLQQALGAVVGSTGVPLDPTHARTQESNVGDLIADVMRAATGADVALLNAGSIRASHVFPAGNLLHRDLVEILPFADILCETQVTGATLQAALDHGVGGTGDDSGRFPQVSGVTFTANPAAPAGQRIRDLHVAGQPLDPAKTYKLALTDYVLEGGDGYAMFKSAKVLVGPEAGGLILKALETFVREHSPIAPKLDGRIRIVTGDGK